MVPDTTAICEPNGTLKSTCSLHMQKNGTLATSKYCRADDLDYNPATDSEAQSSAEGSVSLDTEDAPHSHPDYPIDITGWTYPGCVF